MPEIRIRPLLLVTLIVVIIAAIATLIILGGKYPDVMPRILLSVLVPMLAVAFGYVASHRAMAPVTTPERVREIEQLAEREPTRSKYAWDLARVKLEAYFDRNLSQVNLIFWISVAVMFVGFVFVMLSLTFTQFNTDNTTRLVGTAAGVITESIGATFMFIYKSTMEQARAFMTTLDRINAVGMAVQILDTIPDDAVDLKNATKVELVKALLESASPVGCSCGPRKPLSRKRGHPSVDDPET